MSDTEDFESLPENCSFATHMFAGALAGIAEHTIMYPFDHIKTKMQIIDKQSFRTSMRSIVKETGLFQLWRGVNSVLIGAGPAHALYFATYEHSKYLFNYNSNQSLMAVGVSGAIATMVSEFFMNPFDVIKQRMQLGNNIPHTCAGHTPIKNVVAKPLPYKSVFHCFTSVIKNEGLSSLYVSYPTTIVLAIPFQSIQFVVYEFSRKKIKEKQILESNNVMQHIVSGGIAGGVASFLTTPIDVVKTLLQTRGVSNDPRIKNASSFVEGLGIVYRSQGLGGLLRGWQARVITSVPSCAICWAVYEYFKRIL
jgi:solute carrier family 25 iron transporter 28/37